MDITRKLTACIVFLSALFTYPLLQGREGSTEHIVKEIYEGYVELEDGSEWEIGWFYESTANDWQPGDRLKINYHSYWLNNICLENLNTGTSCWGVIHALPSFEESEVISHIDQFSCHSTQMDVIVLTDNQKARRVFKRPASSPTKGWRVDDHIFVYDNGVLLNMDRAELSYEWVSTTLDDCQESAGSALADVLNLEEKLNQSVIAQSEATKAVASSFMNYYSGLRDTTKPIHVFLFLGPTGVGKTELAKVLAKELKRPLIRIDMSQFPSRWDHWRLIGSAKGYVDSDKGGELTNAIEASPKSVVLLDEVEKAAPEVLKIFLPVFDDGYIRTGRSDLLPCNDIVFIMTSNLCSEKIITLLNEGYLPEEILPEIEPQLISTLSPEFYNRMDPIIFSSLLPETIKMLVDRMMDDLVKTMKSTKGINVIIDESVREYLASAGYHPTLGARPLKRLIQKRIAPAISLAILRFPRQIAKKMIVSYKESTNEILINWSL